MKALQLCGLLICLFAFQDVAKAQKELRISQKGNIISGMEYIPSSQKKSQVLSKNIRNLDPKSLCPDTLFFEQFTDPKYIPMDFINLDMDGQIDANGRPANWFVSTTYETYLGDTNYAASSSSWFSPIGQANNWLITPEIMICDLGFELDWKSAPIEGPAYMDGYKVLISTGSSSIESFTDTLAVFAQNTDGLGVGFSKGTLHTNFLGSNGLLDRWNISLDDYVGQTIHIAFVHDSYDDNLLYIDDIIVRKALEYDLSLLSFESNLEYGITPIKHAIPIGDFVGTIKNNASLPVFDVNLELSIDGQLSGNVFNASATSSTILPGQAVELRIMEEFLPQEKDTYTLYAGASAGQVIGGALASDYSEELEFSDSVYARDNGLLDGSLSIGLGDVGLMGQQYELLQGDVLTSVSYYREYPVVGDSLKILIYDLVNGVPNLLLASSAWLIEEDSLPGFRTAQLEGGALSLPQGEFVLLIEEAMNTRASLGVNESMHRQEVTHVYFLDNWYHNEDFNFNMVYLLRPNFGEVCIEPLAEFFMTLDGDQLQLTNQSTNSVSAQFFWDFGDGNYSNEENPVHQYLANGTYTVCLTVTDNCGVSTTCEPVEITRVSLIERSLSEVKVFPVPANDRLTVSIPEGLEDLQVQLINGVGEVVYNLMGPVSGDIELDLSSLSQGLYHLHLNSNTDRFTHKLIVNH